MRKFCFILILFVTLCIDPLCATDVKVFQLSDAMDGEEILSYMQILRDPEGSLDFAAILDERNQNKFRKVKTDSFGYTEDTFWLKFKIRNPADKELSWLLVLDYSLFDDIQAYSVASGSKPIAVGGDRFPFSIRKIQYRNVVFPFREAAESENTYYIRMKTSGSMIFPWEAYSAEEFWLSVSQEDLILGFYYGAMLVMLVYNLFLLFSTRDWSYAFYVLYLFSYILFQLSLNGLAFQYLWPDSIWWANQCIPFFISFGFFWVLLFSRRFLNSKDQTPKTHLLYYPLLGYSLVSTILSLFLNYLTSVKMGLALCFLTVILIYANGLQCLVKGQKSARFFLIAWTALLLGITVYALKAPGFLPNNFVTDWGIQIGSSLEVILLSLALADRINELSDKLQNRIRELNETKNSLEASEKKFRGVFEESADWLFIMDEKGMILTSNKTSTRLLGLLPKELVGKSFWELLSKAQDGREDFQRFFVNEKFDELLNTRKSVEFRVDFAQKYVLEPRALQVRLQFIQEAGEIQILGSASDPVDDALKEFLQSEKIVFEVSNFLQNAELISHRISYHLAKFTDTNTMLELRSGLREMIVNAIEHGNLQISFDEKTESMLAGNYLELLHARQNAPEHRNKLVRIEYTLNEERLGVRITDQGPGFEHRKMQDTFNKESYENTLSHGRGIFMTKSIFDIVEYNARGNQVLLIKHWTRKELSVS